MDIKEEANRVFGERSKLWNSGFDAGYLGQGCPQGSDPEFEEGYGRGYTASEMESGRWFEQHVEAEYESE